MLEEKRVRSQQEKLVASIRNGGPDRDVQNAFATADQYVGGDKKLFSAPQCIGAMRNQVRWSLLIASGDLPSRQDALSFLASMSVMYQHLVETTWTTGARTTAEVQFHYMLGITVPILQSVGWVDMASAMTTYLWQNYALEDDELRDVEIGLPRPDQWVNALANPYLTHKQSWLSSLTTLSDRTPMQTLGFDPDMDSLGAHWMLAQVWNDPDPMKVRNALTAVREQNVAATFMPETESRPQYRVDEFLLLYDYDIRSVNMRRKLMGLPVVEVEDYIYDMDLPLEVLPFAKDDVFYPAYVKMCEELGVAPYAPDNSINVRVDPETLQVTRV